MTRTANILTGFNPVPPQKAKPERKAIASPTFDQRQATIERIRKAAKSYGRPTAILTTLSGVEVSKIEAFVSAFNPVALELDDLQKLAAVLFDGMHLSDDCELKPGSTFNANAPIATGDVAQPQAIRLPPELPSVKNNLAPPHVNAPTLSRHEAIEAYNLLRGIFDPIPIRTVRDGLRQRVEWNSASDRYIGERLDTLAQILFDNRVLFKFADTTRPNVTLIRVDAEGLDWLRNQAVKNY